MNRRGFIGGLIAALAAPAIIRTPGLIMPVRAAPKWWSFDSIGTDYPLAGSYSIAWRDWRGMWEGYAGTIGGFDFDADNVPLAMERMKKLRGLEARIAASFGNPVQRFT